MLDCSARSSWDKQGTIVTITFLLFASVVETYAIEDFRIAIQNTTNIVLSWPSVAGEAYIIQTRASWDTNSPWTTLSSSYPPAPGTNRTTYTLVGVVPPSPQSAQTSSSSADAMSTTSTKKTEWPPVPWDESTWPKAKTNKSGAGAV